MSVQSWATSTCRRGLALLGPAAYLAAALMISAPALAADRPPSPAVQASSSVPAYERRGDEIEARFRGCRERMELLHVELGNQLRGKAPDLYAMLNAARPAAVPYGYQILPRLVPGPAAGTPPPKVVSTPFGWRRADGFIERDLARLEKLEADTRQAAAMPPEEQRRLWEQGVREYGSLVASQRFIDGYIRYNRLWQADIYRRPAAYAASTALHDAVVERQAIQQRGGSTGQAPDPAGRERERELTHRIRDVTGRLTRPDFIRLDHPEAHLWVIRVPIFTDVEDRPFVDAFRRGVEDIWRVEDTTEEFRVSLEIRHVSQAQLYAGTTPPRPGEHIDLPGHLARFPRGAAILTTGATLTHVNAGRSIVLGPADISLRVLAHELGHILGFADGYFRGYRDQGSDGYEVLEIITDPDDIMSAPGFGRAQRHHFEALLRTFGVAAPASSGGSGHASAAAPAPAGRRDPCALAH